VNHRRITALYVVATGLAVLAGCGGPQSASAPAPFPAAPPSPPQAPPPPDISPRDMLENLLTSGNADWLLLSSMIGDLSVYGTRFGAARFSVSCADGSCTMVPAVRHRRRDHPLLRARGVASAGVVDG